MFGSIVNRPTYLDHLFSSDPAGDPAGGGGGGGGGAGGDGGGNGNDGNGGDADRRFTQSDVDRAASARAAEAKRKAESDLAQQLGVSVDDAKKIIAAHQAQDDKDKTDAQRAREAADAEKAAAEQAKRDATAERTAAQVERALIKSKVKDDALTDAAVLANVAPGATDDEIGEAVKGLVQRRPEFFDAAAGDGSGGDGAGAGGQGGGPPAGDPAGRPAGAPKGQDAYTRGLERAKQLGGPATYAVLEGQKK